MKGYRFSLYEVLPPSPEGKLRVEGSQGVDGLKPDLT